MESHEGSFANDPKLIEPSYKNVSFSILTKEEGTKKKRKEVVVGAGLQFPEEAEWLQRREFRAKLMADAFFEKVLYRLQTFSKETAENIATLLTQYVNSHYPTTGKDQLILKDPILAASLRKTKIWSTLPTTQDFNYLPDPCAYYDAHYPKKEGAEPMTRGKLSGLDYGLYKCFRKYNLFQRAQLPAAYNDEFAPLSHEERSKIEKWLSAIPNIQEVLSKAPNNLWEGLMARRDIETELSANTVREVVKVINDRLTKKDLGRTPRPNRPHAFRAVILDSGKKRIRKTKNLYKDAEWEDQSPPKTHRSQDDDAFFGADYGPGEP